jgi:hypothetical protein
MQVMSFFVALNLGENRKKLDNDPRIGLPAIALSDGGSGTIAVIRRFSDGVEHFELDLGGGVGCSGLLAEQIVIREV